MKIAVTVASNDLKQKVNFVFGRCPGFLIIEVKGKKIKKKEFIENKAKDGAMGAGIAAAQTIANQGIKAVISGNIGPNAFRVLHESKIKVYQVSELSVEDAIQQFSEGKLKETNINSATGHFGLTANKKI